MTTMTTIASIASVQERRQIKAFLVVPNPPLPLDLSPDPAVDPNDRRVSWYTYEIANLWMLSQKRHYEMVFDYELYA